MNARAELPLVADDELLLPEADAAAAGRFIGRSLPRTGARKLLQGRGSYLDDIRVPRLAHVVFVRSPHAHARILGLQLEAARACPGVIAVVDGRALAVYCTPWVGVLGHLKGIKSAEQHAIAIDRVCSQGEAVAAIVAETRRQAEDAADQVLVDWDVLPAVTDMRASLEGSVVKIGRASCRERVCLAV